MPYTTWHPFVSFTSFLIYHLFQSLHCVTAKSQIFNSPIKCRNSSDCSYLFKFPREKGLINDPDKCYWCNNWLSKSIHLLCHSLFSCTIYSFRLISQMSTESVAQLSYNGPRCKLLWRALVSGVPIQTIYIDIHMSMGPGYGPPRPTGPPAAPPIVTPLDRIMSLSMKPFLSQLFFNSQHTSALMLRNQLVSCNIWTLTIKWIKLIITSMAIVKANGQISFLLME